jgi:hypothetical protein
MCIFFFIFMIEHRKCSIVNKAGKNVRAYEVVTRNSSPQIGGKLSLLMVGTSRVRIFIRPRGFVVNGDDALPRGASFFPK